MSFNSKYFYKNLLLGGLLLSFIAWQANDKESSYYWFYNNLIKSNLQFLFGHNAPLTLEQKSELKLGHSYSFLNLVRQSTPENAVILFPDENVFSDQRNQVEFSGYINRKGFASYFLYPRKLVYENEKDENETYKKVDYIAIVNGWGYSKLNYSVNDRIPYSVLPINNQQNTPK